MTQQPYNPYAGQPPAQQPYAGQPQQYPPQYPQAPAQQPYGQPNGYQQQPYQQPAPPPQPLAQGSLDDYYSQPTAGGGPSISWSANNGTVQKPLGTTYAGIVARDVTHGDVQQDTDPKTGAGKFYRDGRPRFVMKVPLKQVLGGPTPQQLGPAPQEFPEGEAQWFVRGQARDELTRAMTAAGLGERSAPKEGDVISVTLVERRPSRGGGMPANIVQVTFQPGPRHQVGAAQEPAAAGGQTTGAASPAPVQASPPAAAPVQQQEQPYYQQQTQAYAQQAQPGPAQPVEQQGPQAAQAQWAQPVQQQAPQQQQQAPQQQQPAQPQQQLTPPAGLDPEQQALLARLQAQQG